MSLLLLPWRRCSLRIRARQRRDTSACCHLGDTHTTRVATYPASSSMLQGPSRGSAAAPHTSHPHSAASHRTHVRAYAVCSCHDTGAARTFPTVIILLYVALPADGIVPPSASSVA
eukprot:354397-Chlamydomonas_euryale.AAC.5